MEALISVDVPLALFEIHQGDVGECTRPHAFRRFGSGTTGATPVFETRFVCQPTRFALETPALQRDYDACWQGFRKLFRS